ncbi:MAG: hypothetical protein JKY19_04105 [Alcanivoracaceae bacterium]|nr:hypothetical protein [Alcanivoracaceae bacterium]
MKTQLNQIITIVGFFSLSIGGTLAISWGMTNLLYHNELAEMKHKHIIIKHQLDKQKNVNFSQSFKLLIPKFNK